MTHILLLGGTTEASHMAQTLADAGITATFSYAGRTQSPVDQPLPVRIGGFGGVAGLQDYLTQTKITHVIDATHPFAAQMSTNAAHATHALNLPLIRLARAPWTPQAADNWQCAARLDDIPAMLPDAPTNIFLAIGKQQIDLFAQAPQHHYLLRLVDAPSAPIPLPHHTVVIARGPFTAEGDTALLKQHKITHIVAKNAGGVGAEAKLIAARALGLRVILANRPALPPAHTVATVEGVMHWLTHNADRGV